MVMKDAGLISGERADKITKWKYFIPMRRHGFDERGLLKRKKREDRRDRSIELHVPFGFLSQEGSMSLMVDPIESTIQMATEVANLAITQVALSKVGEDLIPSWGGMDGWGGVLDVIEPEFGRNSVKLEGILEQLGDMRVIDKEKIDLFKSVWKLRRHLELGEPTTLFFERSYETKDGPSPRLIVKEENRKAIKTIEGELGLESELIEGVVKSVRLGEMSITSGIATLNEYFNSLEELTSGIPDAATMFSTYFPKWETKDSKKGYYQAIIHRKGKPVLVEMNQDFYNSISLLVNKHTAGPIRGIVRGLARMVKAGAVRCNMIFAMKNVVRDLITNNFQSKHQGPIEGIKDPFYWLSVAFLHKAAKEDWPILKNFKGKLNEVVELFEQAGGSMMSWFFKTKDGSDRIQDILERKHVVDGKKGSGVFGSIKSLANWYVDVVGLSDIGPRLAEFYKVLKEAGYEVNRNWELVYTLDKDGKRLPVEQGVRRTPPGHVVVRARAAAADVTTNFGREGWMAEYFNQETIFLGAAIQGFDKMIRTVKDEISRLEEAREVGEFAKELAKSRLMWATTVTMALEVAYYMSRADDDDFQTQPWWEKFSYWTMTDGAGNPVVRIPKGYGWSAISNVTHAIMDTAYRKDPEALYEVMWHTWSQEFPFDPATLLRQSH